MIGAPKSALRAFFLPRVIFIFNENHCKFIAICSISVLDTSEGNKHVIQHPVWSVSALYMLFLSVKASHALFFTIHSAERAFQSHPCLDWLIILVMANNFHIFICQVVMIELNVWTLLRLTTPTLMCGVISLVWTILEGALSALYSMIDCTLVVDLMVEESWTQSSASMDLSGSPPQECLNLR